MIVTRIGVIVTSVDGSGAAALQLAVEKLCRAA